MDVTHAFDENESNKNDYASYLIRERALFFGSDEVFAL